MPESIVARRALRSLEGDRATLVLYAPYRERPPLDEWGCRIELRRQRKKDNVALVGRGMDGLQALINALKGARREIAPLLSTFTWTGEPGHVGLPVIAGESDATYASLIEHLLEAEQCRVAMQFERDSRALRQQPRGAKRPRKPRSE